MREPLPPHTSANSARPDPAESLKSSAVARCAAHEKILHGGRQRAEELAEREVVTEVAALLGLVISRNGTLDLEAGPRECDPVAY
jgi:hypothetical protein